VGSAPVEELAPGQCAPVSLSGAVSVSSGLWHVAAWMDRADAVTERVESNNIRLGDRLPAGRAPDLVLAEVSAPGSVAVAQPVRATARVCNPGTAPSAAATVSFFLSLDASITTSDSLLGSALVPELQAGACAPVELTGLADVQEGSWHVGAYVDSDHRMVELSENNNARAGGVLGVGDGADLYISSISGPAHLQDVQSFTGQITVCNQGTQTARESARVGVFLSSDAAITASDILVGDVSLPELAAGQCTTVSVPGARLPGGTWHVGAIVDLEGREHELLKDNNTRVGSSLAIRSTLAALYAPGAVAHD
jgi:subtilase family serine protease